MHFSAPLHHTLEVVLLNLFQELFSLHACHTLIHHCIPYRTLICISTLIACVSTQFYVTSCISTELSWQLVVVGKSKCGLAVRCGLMLLIHSMRRYTLGRMCCVTKLQCSRVQTLASHVVVKSCITLCAQSCKPRLSRCFASGSEIMQMLLHVCGTHGKHQSTHSEVQQHIRHRLSL